MADQDARARLIEAAKEGYLAAAAAGHSIEHVIDAVLSDANFNDVIRVLGGKVAGLDQRMRSTWGSSVLFKQGTDLYQWGNP